MTAVTRAERGWAGHFFSSRDCGFHRNTLISKGEQRIVVSTVGNQWGRLDHEPEAIGGGNGDKAWRYYETMAFLSDDKDGMYHDIDVKAQVSFDAPWAISADTATDLPEDVDNHADRMHEAVVAWVMGNFDKAHASGVARLKERELDLAEALKWAT